MNYALPFIAEIGGLFVMTIDGASTHKVSRRNYVSVRRKKRIYGSTTSKLALLKLKDYQRSQYSTAVINNA